MLTRYFLNIAEYYLQFIPDHLLWNTAEKGN